jgi:CBS domain-containing protein
MRVPPSSVDNVGPSLFLGRVKDVITRPPVVCLPSVSAREVARLLSGHGVGSVVVLGADADPVGIVTDRDLRRKVVAEGRDAATTRAGDIMSAPLVSIRPEAFAFEAILEMTRRGIRHLVVSDHGRLTGVVSIYDFVLSESLHPVLLAREITRTASLEGLTILSARITDLTRRLLAEGGTAYDVGQMIAALNDRVVERVLALAAATLAEAGLEAPGVRYCWLSFGSEARREQTLRTDQDNGLVFEDPPVDLGAQAAAYYARLGEVVVGGLVHVGVPPCPGGIMASNPRWCQPLARWRDYFHRWITDPTPDQVLGASIHFDLRPLGGAPELAEALHDAVRQEIPSHSGFLRVLARDVVERRVPLTLLGRIATRRSDPHRGALDLKGGGTLQLVGAARVHALELGLSVTNTIDRFRGAEARQIYTAAEAREVSDAVQHLMRLRLLHQLEQLGRGGAPDNFVVPAELSHADRVLLREALRTVGWVQTRVRERFATDFVSG